MQNKTIFLFRRDLRLEDNTGLIRALKESKQVIPCFILDPRQKEENEYFSQNAFQFMIESLIDLDKQLKSKGSKLYIFKGSPSDIIGKLKPDALYVNRDYTPFSINRDNNLKNKFNFISSSDLLIHEPEECLKSNREPYTIFTPFYKNAINLSKRSIQKNNHSNYYNGNLGELNIENIKYYKNQKLFRNGGRNLGIELLNTLKIEDYNLVRNFPSINGTTGLSPYLKFGCISIREAYRAFEEKGYSELIRQLYWRDFFTHIAFHFPYVFGNSFKKKYDKIRWHQDSKKFKAWCQGETGFPIVDAGMRELNETGYMHNRVRMVVASFLVKDLNIDWRLGEKYFAQLLVDYDPCVNNGSWQWAASTGCDAQPYFRIFNPWLQQKKFDEDCVYIKKWVPELEKIDNKLIHKLYSIDLDSKYPKPIVDHQKAKNKTLFLYKSI